jgi:hypothetical protein
MSSIAIVNELLLKLKEVPPLLFLCRLMGYTIAILCIGVIQYAMTRRRNWLIIYKYSKALRIRSNSYYIHRVHTVYVYAKGRRYKDSYPTIYLC